MLQCPLGPSSLYPSLVLALRDMRTANGRNEVDGSGDGNESWIGLSLGMTVLDSLTPEGEGFGVRFRRLLTTHGVESDDANAIAALRNSLLHGYGLPKSEKVHGRRMVLTPEHDAFALDTRFKGFAVLSVPVFCARLVERIINAAPDAWDTSLIETNAPQIWKMPPAPKRPRCLFADSE